MQMVWHYKRMNRKALNYETYEFNKTELFIRRRSQKNVNSFVLAMTPISNKDDTKQ